MERIELYNDHFQNFKRYGIPKAQLIIADRMAATEKRLQTEGKLYRLRIPCGEIVGTIDLLKEYAKQLKIDNKTIQKL